MIAIVISSKLAPPSKATRMPFRQGRSGCAPASVQRSEPAKLHAGDGFGRPKPPESASRKTRPVVMRVRAHRRGVCARSGLPKTKSACSLRRFASVTSPNRSDGPPAAESAARGARCAVPAARGCGGAGAAWPGREGRAHGKPHRIRACGEANAISVAKRSRALGTGRRWRRGTRDATARPRRRFGRGPPLLRLDRRRLPPKRAERARGRLSPDGASC